MTTSDAAAEAAAEVVQKAAAPIAFIAVVVAGALAVAVLVKRFGQSLPLPAYVGEFLAGADAGDQVDDDDVPDNADELEHAHDQWS